MKKVICLIAVALLVASVVYAAKMRVTAKDLPALKGTWTGVLTFGTVEATSSPVKLEILNDTLPLKAKLTVNDLPQTVAASSGLTAGQHVGEADNGAITTAGTILFMGVSGNFFELTLTAKNKMSIWYAFRTLRGEGNVNKK